MRELKHFVATLAVLCVLTLTGIVAFRLAPETWAMIAGVIFGVVAALPMCAVVIMMLRRPAAAPPPVQPIQQQPPAPLPGPPQIILLHPGIPVGMPYGGPVPALRRMLAAPTYAWAQPPTPAWEGEGEWASDEGLDEGDWGAPDPYAAPQWSAPAPPRGRGYRVLGG